ncbi:hypothetical protein GA840_01590 [Pediococcus ethanolidurans]|uniref:hypothetical protein n=1 Tax=Pediococcus ethanolidurans TaxID=319653 RepID=UPI002954EDFE|nr:hypothetical protein [Pediococcus ethanolidurans]MDV7718574.1 hypothetical protein [Pediococcus ethanolidurans]
MEYKPMHLIKGDIKSNYSDLYNLLEPDISEDKLHVTIHSQKQWYEIQDLFTDCIAGSLNSAGELNQNGLRLEHILDFA